VNDGVAHALAQRRGLDSGFWPGTVASTVMHGALAAALLLGLGSRAATYISVLPVSSVPLGEIMGIPSPSQGSSAASPESVSKPSGATRRGTSLPSSMPRPSQSLPVGAGQDAGTSAPSRGGSPLTIGDPHGLSSPYAWYLAGVQAKVWAIWVSQARPDFVTPVEVQFTILEDGSLVGPHVVTPSGNIALDLAATRAIVSAAPFAPLPKDIQTKPFTIRAQFRPDR
jgi:TonB family protein